jgi:hypothetical protein
MTKFIGHYIKKRRRWQGGFDVLNWMVDELEKL